MKQKLKKLDKKTEEMFKASSVAILLENMNDNFKLLAEGQTIMNRKFDGLENRFDGLEVRFDGLEARFGGLENEMRTGFAMVMDYLKRIDEELVALKKDTQNLEDKKADSTVCDSLEKRLKDAEKEIQEIRFLLKKKRVNA